MEGLKPRPISVALCTYNGVNYLGDQLESILNQSQPIDELIICDDRSTDGSKSILNTYQQRYPEIITLHENEVSLGAVKNFERAISLTSGTFVFLADQDDVWEPHKIETMMAYFNAHPHCLLLFTNASLIDANSKHIEGTLWGRFGFDEELQQQWKNQHFQIQALIQNQNKITGATIGFRSVLKADVLPMDLPNKVWHDCFLGLMASKYNGLHFLNLSLVRYRIHAGQQVGLGETKKYPINSNIDFLEFRKRLAPDFEPYMTYYDQKYLGKKKEAMRFKDFIKRLKGKVWPF